MTTKYKDGSGGKKKQEIIESESILGRRFDKVGGSTSGDHWIIDASGNLQLRDNDGLISTAHKVN